MGTPPPTSTLTFTPTPTFSLSNDLKYSNPLTIDLDSDETNIIFNIDDNSTLINGDTYQFTIDVDYLVLSTSRAYTALHCVLYFYDEAIIVYNLQETVYVINNKTSRVFYNYTSIEERNIREIKYIKYFDTTFDQDISTLYFNYNPLKTDAILYKIDQVSQNIFEFTVPLHSANTIYYFNANESNSGNSLSLDTIALKIHTFPFSNQTKLLLNSQIVKANEYGNDFVGYYNLSPNTSYKFECSDNCETFYINFDPFSLVQNIRLLINENNHTLLDSNGSYTFLSNNKSFYFNTNNLFFGQFTPIPTPTLTHFTPTSTTTHFATTTPTPTITCTQTTTLNVTYTHTPTLTQLPSYSIYFYFIFENYKKHI